MAIQLCDLRFGDDEFNLMQMYKHTLILAFERYPVQKNSIPLIGAQLGISSRTVYRFSTYFELRHLLTDKNE